VVWIAENFEAYTPFQPVRFETGTLPEKSKSNSYIQFLIQIIDL